MTDQHMADQDINDFEAQANAEDGVNLGFTVRNLLKVLSFQLIVSILQKELIDEIRDKKESNPGMFVSAWQDDTEGLEEKNMEDPIEKWLTAAEDGELELVKVLLEETPNLLNVSFI